MKTEKFYTPIIKILAFFGSNLLVIIPFSFFLKKNLVLDNILMIIINIIMVFIAFLLFKDKLKNQFQDFQKHWKKNLKIIFKYWFIGLLLMMIVNLIINVFILKNIAPNEEANRNIIEQYPVYAILSIALLTPITEELLFRLNFKDTFKKKSTFVLTTGILFGLMHVIASLENPLYLLYLIPYSILGFTFGLIFYDTKNVTSSIIAHSLHNSISLLIIFLGI